MANHEFVAYIDESGDDGLSKFRQPRALGGSSNWLVLGCCIVRRVNDLSLVSHRDAILHALNKTNIRQIHFSKLNHAQRMVVVQAMAKMPIRLTHVLCCKRDIPNISIYPRRGQLYWYLCRTLIERISWFCSENSKTGNPLAQIIFSNRGGMKYKEFRDYLTRLKNTDTQIRWSAISPDAVRSEVHTRFAGLQFADATSTSFASAVEANMYGNYEPSYAMALRPAVYRRRGNFLSYGVKPRCNYAALDERQNQFFAFYGKK